jgi:hypothetical protein
LQGLFDEIVDEGLGDDGVPPEGPGADMPDEPGDDESHEPVLVCEDGLSQLVEASAPAPVVVGPLSTATGCTIEYVARTVAVLIGECKRDLELAQELACKSRGEEEYLDSRVISLVLFEGQVLWVRWTDGRAWEGRPIVVHGDDNAIQAIVAHRVSVQSYHGCTVLLPRAPVSMKMRKSTYADKMPEWAMSLYRWHLAQHFSGPLDASDRSTPPCIVCRTGDACEIEAGSEDWGLYRCKVCATVWHRECAFAYSGVRDNAVFPVIGFTCPVCL